jgi:serine/threonine protein kinase
MLLSAGDKLGPYEILAPISAGGLGEVWKARETRLDRIVAIKQLKASIWRDSSRGASAVLAHRLGPERSGRRRARVFVYTSGVAVLALAVCLHLFFSSRGFTRLVGTNPHGPWMHMRGRRTEPR